MEFDPSAIEAKWQQKWEEAKIFETDLKKAKDPFYSLVMFPYPSGDKLHVGHWYNFAPADSAARFMRMKGKDVMTPMGFDAFGLPAENYAIKSGIHPDTSTRTNVQTMVKQLKRMGCMYDWSKMVNTSTPEYYRWTQWLFLQMYEHKIAYKKEAPVNFCPSCQTVLANEQAQDGTCDRCGTTVIQKNLNQWFWKISQFAQRLLDGLKDLAWPAKTKIMQENWIGRSEGINFQERVKDLNIEFEVYDSIPQTFLAQTFTVIAPDHPLVSKLVSGTSYEKPVMEFVERIRKKKLAAKFKIEEESEGIFTGRYVDNPFGTGDLPIWVCSYVLADYGTGIVNCSAHDERDFAFAKKYDIPLKIALLPQDPALAEKVKNFEVFYREPDGIIQVPEVALGMTWEQSRKRIIDYIEGKGYGQVRVHFRLRDWLISRQRYWGAPIPIVYDPEGKPHPVPEKHLPWLLPTDVAFKPTGKSPLTESKEFIERTEKLFGKGWTPEFDTMDTFVCSSYYYLRYLAEGDEKHLVDPTIEKRWMPVSMYIGGPEHACMHLIYARFVMMALKDFGFVSHEEPFKKLVHQGLITNKGAKMSKSKGNVVSPDSLVERHGSDAFRMYLMFMGPFTEGGDWSDTGIKGIDRFVKRIHAMFTSNVNKKVDQSQVLASLHRTIKKVTEDIEALRFNTAISALMELLNLLEQEGGVSSETAKTFTLLLAPLAPHLAEELWESLGGKGFVIEQRWPMFDPKLTKASTHIIAIQVNGKLRGEIEVDAGASKEDVLSKAKAHPNVQKFLTGEVKKEIYVAGKLVSLVV
ncbi:MAG: leucine--tRNA ligase [Candidatus Peribacteraceae bacterium]|nr:leucine--tRNA ligase [Candidatus Peribacteraceae bacterium]MDD5739203.1 leucine--tRNA ligase [Candidatus Peribacteraceae bacterium]